MAAEQPPAVRVEQLRELGAEDAKRLIHGYDSPARYAVRRTRDDGLVRFTLELVDEPFVKRFQTSDRMAAWYASLLPDNLSFGAYDGSGLIGLAVAQRQEWNDTCVLWELHVDSSWRRRGIGAELIGNVERSAAAAGLRRVWLETQATNPAAIDFYTSAGYEVAGLDLTYYSNRDPATGEVAIFMAKATL